MDLFLPIILTLFGIFVTIFVMLIKEIKWLKQLLVGITIGLFISFSAWIIFEKKQNKELQQKLQQYHDDYGKLKLSYDKLKIDKDSKESKYTKLSKKPEESMEKPKQSTKVDKSHSTPIIYGPDIVDEGVSIQILSGKLLVTLYMNISYSGYTVQNRDNNCSENYSARAIIKYPNNEERILCLNKNDKKQFLFEDKIYFINLLGIGSRQEKKLMKKSTPPIYGGPEHEEVPYDINTFKISIVRY